MAEGCSHLPAPTPFFKALVLLRELGATPAKQPYGKGFVRGVHPFLSKLLMRRFSNCFRTGLEGSVVMALV